MTSLLDNELVRKYFGCDITENGSVCGACYSKISCTWAAFRVLEAMQQLPKKGERYLYVLPNGNVEEEIASFEHDEQHDVDPRYLRLPDKFQPKNEKPVLFGFTQDDILDLRYVCDMRNMTPKEMRQECVNAGTPPKPDPVEDWISRIKRYCRDEGAHLELMDEYLRDLVKLARKAK